MKVLFFLFDGFDQTNGSNHLHLTSIHELLRNGIEVYLISSHTTGVYSDIPPSLQGKKGFTYSIIQRKVVKKTSFSRRYLDGINYAIKASREWKKHKKEIDAVILQSTPTAWISSFLMHLWLKKPVIYNTFDMFPDGPYNYGAIKNKFVYGILSKLQDGIYKRSKKIVAISSDMKKNYIKKGISENKIEIIPNWYDSDSIHTVNEEKNAFINKYNIERGKFIVQYAGNIGYTFNYKAIIEIAKYLKDDDNIQFHIIGNGGFEESLKKGVEDEGLTNIIFFPWQESSIIYDVYSSCNIELIPLSKGVIWTSFPSKCTLLMACGRSFLCLCEKESDYFQFVNSKKIGLCIERTSYKEAAEALRDLANNKWKLSEWENNGKIIGKELFSSEVNAPKYAKLLREMVGEEND